MTRIETKPSIDRHKDIDSHSSGKKAEEAPAEKAEEAPAEKAEEEKDE